MWRTIVVGLVAAMGAVMAGCGVIAPDIPYEVLEARYGNAASRYMDLPGDLRVHYRDEGPRGAPALVMVHGFAASLHTWEPWAVRFARDHRVIRLDLPGHGLTRAPTGYRSSLEGNVAVVEAVTRRLGAERFVLIGNSMGGAVAWNYALAHPDRLNGLVLVNAAGWPVADRRDGGPPLVFKLLRTSLGRAVLRHANPRPLTTPGLKQAYVDQALVTDALVDRYVELARAPGHREMVLASQGAPRKPVDRAVFARISTPTLVIHGEADAVIPVEAGRGLAGAIPGAVLVTWPDVGHVPMEQIPDRSAEALELFLNGLPRSRAGAEPAAKPSAKAP